MLSLLRLGAYRSSNGFSSLAFKKGGFGESSAAILAVLCVRCQKKSINETVAVIASQSRERARMKRRKKSRFLKKEKTSTAKKKIRETLHTLK